MRRRGAATKSNPPGKPLCGAISVALWTAGLAAGVALARGVPAASRHAQFRFTFTPQELGNWEFPRLDDWLSKTENDLTYLHMVRPGEPGVPRRPLQFARIKNVIVGSFNLSVKARREGRSMIVVFNYVDTLHFYYAHISHDRGTEQPVHNGIFLVDGGPRRRIAGIDAPPALPDTAWHTIRVVRSARTGLIQVFSDVQKAPLFSVVDKHFTCGEIGLGSFDEIGDFADFELNSDDAGCAPQKTAAPTALLEPPR